MSKEKPPKKSFFSRNAVRDRSFSERAGSEAAPLKERNLSLSENDYNQGPPTYATLMKQEQQQSSQEQPPPQQYHQPPYPQQQQYQPPPQHYHHQPQGMPMYQYHPVMQQAPPQPIIMNQMAPPTAAAASQPTNIIINANGAGDGRNNHNGAAAVLGGFECPFCHMGVMKKRRNPLMKLFILIIAIVTFPFGLLACVLCFCPCAYQSQCTTCKKKI